MHIACTNTRWWENSSNKITKSCVSPPFHRCKVHSLVKLQMFRHHSVISVRPCCLGNRWHKTDHPSDNIKGSVLANRTCKSCWKGPQEQLLLLCRADEGAVIARDVSPSCRAADGDRSAGLGAVSACKLSDFISVTGQFTPTLTTFGRYFRRTTRLLNTLKGRCWLSLN